MLTIFLHNMEQCAISPRQLSF